MVAIQTILIGILTIAFIFFGAFLSSQKKCRLSLKITPLILLICSCFVFFLPTLLPFGGMWPLLFLSMAQLVLVKSSKYGLMDPVKEITYISLDNELKNKGKAAVDGMSNRFGKTGGNILQQLLFIAVGSLSGSIELFALCILIFALLWLRSASRLEV